MRAPLWLLSIPLTACFVLEHSAYGQTATPKPTPTVSPNPLDPPADRTPLPPPQPPEPKASPSPVPKPLEAVAKATPTPAILPAAPSETPEPLPQEAVQQSLPVTPAPPAPATLPTASPSPSPSPSPITSPSTSPNPSPSTSPAPSQNPLEVQLRKELQPPRTSKSDADAVQNLSDLTTISPGNPAPKSGPAQPKPVLVSPGLIDAAEPPPKPDELPIYLKRVDTLLRQRDESMAISYLRRIVPSGILSDRDRSQAILELADCLTDTKQPGEALVWLRLWTGLFSARPEAGAVDFRIGCLYEYMRMPREARDTFYLALSATINQSRIQDSVDLGQYSCLTADILWKMAENEYACGQYARAAQLFDRYLREATSASPLSQEKAQFLEADSNYQLHDLKNSTVLYEKAINSHPFNPLVPEARLRLYHLYMMQNRIGDAEADLKALAWTVRTVWPNDETKWQKRALELLLEVNKGDPGLQVPILAAAGHMHVGSELQDELDHYTQLNALQDEAVPVTLQGAADKKLELNEIRGEDLKIDTMGQSINHLLPTE